MAMRHTVNLAKGTQLTDYANPSRIMRAFDGDMSRIRAEYSRQRSIIRKRIERMESAGEVHNDFYRRFGNMKESIPSLKGLSNEQVMRAMSGTANALVGGYQTTLKEIRQARQEAFEEFKAQAENAGDKKLVAELNKQGLTSEAYDNIKTLMGYMQNAGVIKFKPSKPVYDAVIKEYYKRKDGESLADIASKVVKKLRLRVSDDQRAEIMENIQRGANASGGKTVSFDKARKKRGT